MARGDLPKISNDFSLSGSQSLRFNFGYATDPGQPNNNFCQQDFALGGPYPEVWFSYDVYYPAGFTPGDSGSNTHYKTIQIKTDNPSGGSYAYMSHECWPTSGGDLAISFKINGNGNSNGYWTPTGGTGDTSSVSYGWKAPYLGTKLFFEKGVDEGRWVHYVWHMRCATTGEYNELTGSDGSKYKGEGHDGAIELWKDGALLFSQLGVPNHDATKNWYTLGYLQGWCNVDGYAVQTDIYYDTFKVSTEPLI